MQNLVFRILVLVLLIFVQASHLYGQMASVRKKTERQDRDCGAKCLYVLMRQFNCGESEYRELLRRMGAPTDQGYSMLQLRDAARQSGLSAECIKLEKDQLKSLNKSVGIVLHLQPGHFVILQAATDEDLVVLDATTGKPRYSPIDGLSEWSGNALAVCKGPLELFQTNDSGARAIWGSLITVCIAIAATWFWRKRRVAWIVLVPLVGQLGCHTQLGVSESSNHKTSVLLIEKSEYNLDLPQETGSAYRLPIALKNDSEFPIEVNDVKLSCYCASAQLSSMRIEPNSTANLWIMLDRKTVGQHSVSCSVISSGRTVAHVSVRWNVSAGVVVEPKRLDLQLGSGQSQSMGLTLSWGDPVDFSQLTFVNEFSSQSLPFAGNIAFQANVENQSVSVSFAAKGQVPRANINGAILIRHSSLPTFSAKVPYSIKLKNPVDITPEVLFLVEHEGRYSGQLLVMSDDSSQLESIKVVCADRPELPCSFSTVISSGMAIIDVSLSHDTANLVKELAVSSGAGYSKKIEVRADGRKEP